MANYSTLKGIEIQTLATDPYASEISAGTWASAPARVTGTNSGAGAGTQSAMVTFGGNAAPGYSTSGITQTYNGTAWSVSPVSITARYLMAGFGTATAAISAGGAAPTTGITEEFDGSTWTEVNALNNVASHTAGCGTSTAGIKTGGDVPGVSPNLSGNSEKWNGTSWTEVTGFTSGRTNMATGGTQDSCLVMGGSQVPAHVGFVEEYNGTSWSEKADTNTDRSHVGCSANGTTTAMLFIGGGLMPPGTVQAVTEYWNGTSWTEVGDLGTATAYNVGGGTSTAAINVAGSPPGISTQVEEFSLPSAVSVAGEGQVWYNTTSNVLKGFNGSAIKTFTSS